MNLFRKKIISLALVVSLFAVAGGFCYASTASAATNYNSGITQHGTSARKNMANHANDKGAGVKLCCVDNEGSVLNNSALSIKSKIKFVTSEILVADASSQSLNFYKDSINISSMSPPQKGELSASVVKKE
ncbi:MAG: hypothetical protein PHP62_00580 [Candidatus Moranbacteria bacterium]|nr:hypothetical protein [Candidatus Moranbacteria bacterium]